MATKLSDLPTPELIHSGTREWWRFGNQITVTYGISSKGPCFCCHTDPNSHDCIHIRAMQRHLNVTDFRNKRPEDNPFL